MRTLHTYWGPAVRARNGYAVATPAELHRLNSNVGTYLHEYAWKALVIHMEGLAGVYAWCFRELVRCLAVLPKPRWEVGSLPCVHQPPYSIRVLCTPKEWMSLSLARGEGPGERARQSCSRVVRKKWGVRGKH